MVEKNRKKTEIKISGMTCASCASTIEKSLSKLSGVTKAQVNLGSETATVEYDSNKVRLPDFNKAVADVGYDVINEKTVIKIGGMTCAMCVKTNEEILNKLEGVISAHVNLGAEKAYVTYNPKLATIPDIKKAIEGVGYQFLSLAITSIICISKSFLLFTLLARMIVSAPCPVPAIPNTGLGGINPASATIAIISTTTFVPCPNKRKVSAIIVVVVIAPCFFL